MSAVKPIPENSSSLIPMLVCRDPSAEIAFCKTTFGAAELGSRPGPDGAVAHALMSKLGPGSTVATIVVDSGLRYVSTDVFRA